MRPCFFMRKELICISLIIIFRPGGYSVGEHLRLLFFVVQWISGRDGPPVPAAHSILKVADTNPQGIILSS